MILALQKKEEYERSQECDSQLIVLTETWLHDSFNSSNLFSNAYAVYRQDRDNSLTKTSRLK